MFRLTSFEIQGITGPTANAPECTGLPGGAICITIPANSFGYFKVPVYSSPREGLVLTDEQLTLYPNPSSSSFKIECDLPEVIINEFVVDIIDIDGKNISHIVVGQNIPIDISKISSGIYFVSISNIEKTFNIVKKLIKIE